MKIIAKLVKLMYEEIDAADDYAELANEYKYIDKELSDIFIKLADGAITHVDAIHKITVKKIEESRAKDGEPPKEMLIIWDYEHKKLIEELNETKVLIEITKRGS